jgi:hypothetical protein
MVETADPEATIEEIVVALRETRQGASKVPPFTVVDGGQPSADNGGAATLRPGSETAAPRGQTPEVQNEIASTDIGDLRDKEIERLLTENTRLNERIVFLLKVIEREQGRNADNAIIKADREVISHDMKIALEAEIRPFLLSLLGLFEKQRQTAGSNRPAVPEAARPAAPVSST